MATLASATRPPFSHDISPSPSSDPFWQHNPRTTPNELASLMAAVQQVSLTSGPSRLTSPVTLESSTTPVDCPNLSNMPNVLRKRPPLNRSQVVQLPRTSMPATPPKSPKQPLVTGQRRPACTHMHIIRRYVSTPCGNCGKVPSLGWLYACQQDWELSNQGRVLVLPNPDNIPDELMDRSANEIQAQIAEVLGLKSDVVQGIRDMDYTYEQAAILIRQKKHVLETIRRTCTSPSKGSSNSPVRGDSVISSLGAKATPSTQAAASSDLPMTPAGTPTNTPLESATTTSVKQITKLRSQAFCNYQVCHSCRPFFQDRLYMSFEAALSGKMPAVTEAEIAQLPILHPSIVRNMGLRQRRLPPLPLMRSHESMDITAQHQHLQHDGSYEDDNDAADWTPTSITISEESDSDQNLDPAERFPCPGVGICPVWSPETGCAYDNGFDDPFRASNHGYVGPTIPHFLSPRMTPENSYHRLRHMRSAVPPETPGGASTSTASSISLPTPDTVPLTPLRQTEESFNDAFDKKLVKAGGTRKARSVGLSPPSPGRDYTHAGRYQNVTFRRGQGLGILGDGLQREDRNSSSSSLGSEVEVEGGVALTEEAVELGRPDIVTDD